MEEFTHGRRLISRPVIAAFTELAIISSTIVAMTLLMEPPTVGGGLLSGVVFAIGVEVIVHIRRVPLIERTPYVVKSIRRMCDLAKTEQVPFHIIHAGLEYMLLRSIEIKRIPKPATANVEDKEAVKDGDDWPSTD